MEKREIYENLSSQLSEIEVLQSMFCKPGEFCMDDVSALADLSDYLEGKHPCQPSELDFSLNIMLDSKHTIEISVHLPRSYPTSGPDIYCRSQTLSRGQQLQLNQDLSLFLNEMKDGEPCITQIVYWVLDHGEHYFTEVKEEVANKEIEDDSCTRYWIYSHHIYNKLKRKMIIDTAKCNELSGFCLPGKPGILCVEGKSINCLDFWNKIKSLTWQKITCIKTETEELSGCPIQKKFQSFEEVSFRKESARDGHMDMGELYRYLQHHQCSHIFKDYFGIDGKSSED